jgi:hypothetical protein
LRSSGRFRAMVRSCWLMQSRRIVMCAKSYKRSDS